MITAIRAAQRFDSRGNPTVQVEVQTGKGWFRALVPSGASTGSHEAVELRDKGPSFGGKSVHTAVRNVEETIAPALLGQHLSVATQLREIDDFLCKLDGTPNKAKLGANAILGVSMACARAGAAETGVPLYEYLRRQANVPDSHPYVLPVPFFNVVNGGVHAGNTMAFQETMMAPTGAASFEQAMQMGAEVYQELKRVIADQYGAPATGVGDEGGFAPPITSPEQAFDLLQTAIARRGYTGKISFGMDPASSEFFTADGRYDIGFKDKAHEPRVLSPDAMQDLYRRLLRTYPIVLLEDPFAEDDWPTWTAFNADCPVELVGDDLLVTNVDRVKLARDRRACNAMLLKLNQIGTVSEAIAAAQFAFSLGWGVFVSHRSGETTDDFIADLTVALATGHLKSGAPCRGERVAKYNRLLDIEQELRAAHKPVVYAGAAFRTANKIVT